MTRRNILQVIPFVGAFIFGAKAVSAKEEPVMSPEDKVQWHQTLMQLHDKQCISTRTLCEEMGIDYDEEYVRLM